MTAFGAPPTKKQPVTDTYHDESIVDNYRWLEDGDSPATRDWTAAQNKHTRDYLDGLPHEAAIRRQVTAILKAKSVNYGGVQIAGGAVFAIKRQPPKQQPFLIVMDDLDSADAARVVVDPNAIDERGETLLDWYAPSPDGKLVAVSLSRSGTESGDVHIYDVATGEAAHEIVPRVNGGTAGGDLVWSPDGKGLFYTRYPRGDERPAEDMNFFQQLYYHTLGEPTEKDRYELGEGLPRIAEIQLDMHPGTGRLLATVQDGDGGEFAHFLRSPDGKWRQFSEFGDGFVHAAFGPEDDLFVVSRRGAPRGEIRRMNGGDLSPASAKVIVPEGEHAIVTEFWDRSTPLYADGRLYVIYQLGGPSEVRVFDIAGKQLNSPEQPAVASIDSLQSVDGGVLMQTESFTSPGRYLLYDPRSGKTRATSLVDESAVDLGDVEVIREMATSKDGTQVPLTILLPKGTKRDGKAACIANGYGGYGINIAPRFRSLNRVLMDQGVIYVIANLRGGSEFGEAWHRGGNLTNKQNVFDDFAAVLRHLIERRYTSSDRLAIIGGSNGGLLMGATMTQHPELMNAVVTKVGIYDMLRVELSPNGAFNIPEFGTVKDRDQYNALRAYSPYHQVRDGFKYPATLLTTGENDPRVDPMQSRKMTARLQAANSAETPILLRTTADAGHGADASLDERIDQEVDVLQFLFHQLQVEVAADAR